MEISFSHNGNIRVAERIGELKYIEFAIFEMASIHIKIIIMGFFKICYMRKKLVENFFVHLVLNANEQKNPKNIFLFKLLFYEDD